MNGKGELVLGLTIDNKLLFDSQIKNISRKACQKIMHYLEYHTI